MLLYLRGHVDSAHSKRPHHWSPAPLLLFPLVLCLHPCPQIFELPLQGHLHGHQGRTAVLEYGYPVVDRDLLDCFLLHLFGRVVVHTQPRTGHDAADGDEGHGAGEDHAVDGLVARAGGGVPYALEGGWGQSTSEHGDRIGSDTLYCIGFCLPSAAARLP